MTTNVPSRGKGPVANMGAGTGTAIDAGTGSVIGTGTGTGTGEFEFEEPNVIDPQTSVVNDSAEEPPTGEPIIKPDNWHNG